MRRFLLLVVTGELISAPARPVAELRREKAVEEMAGGEVKRRFVFKTWFVVAHKQTLERTTHHHYL